MKYSFLLLLTVPHLLHSQTVRIDPEFNRQTVDIPGYKLVFDDEFNTLDRSVWDLSGPGNDGPSYDAADFLIKSNQVTINPSNVSEPLGSILKIQARKGEDRNMTPFSAGEIKTFNNHSWSNHPPNFRNWTMTPGQYLEARIKIPYCPGINSALWLYGITGAQDDPDRRFFEVDIIESFSEIPSHFWTNIHYGKAYADKSHRSKGREIKVKSLKNKKVVLKDIWLTFGLEYNETDIRMYLNGALYNTYKLYPNSTKKKYRYLKALPAFIRLGVGKASVESTQAEACQDYPVFLDIDYVRLYTKENLPSIYFLNNYENIWLSATKGRENSGFNMQVNYIPGVKYRVIDEKNQLDITHNENYITACQCAQWWISPKENSPTGPAWIKVMAEFPGGNAINLGTTIQIIP